MTPALSRAFPAFAPGTGGVIAPALPPGYYARIGCLVVPAWRPSCTRPDELAVSGPHAPWAPVDPRRDVATLAAAYERHHRGAHVYRDPARFLRNVELNPGDVYFGLGAPLVGYVRLAIEDGTVEVVENAVPEAYRAAVLRSAARLAVCVGAKEA